MAAPLSEFRKEFKARVMDFATVYQIISPGNVSSQEDKIEKNDEYYERLERWVLERFNTWLINKSDKVSLEVTPVKEESVKIEWPDVEKNHDTDLDF